MLKWHIKGAKWRSFKESTQMFIKPPVYVSKI
jgi:hypothetical protein